MPWTSGIYRTDEQVEGELANIFDRQLATALRRLTKI